MQFSFSEATSNKKYGLSSSPFSASNNGGLGYLVQRQSDSGSRGGDCASKGCTDGNAELVRRGSKQGLEAFVPDNTKQCKDRQSASGSLSMGNDAKPLVEVFHRSTSDHREGSRGLEQVKKAFGSAPLGRIRMGSLREEGDRLQGISNDSPRECANNEIDSDSQKGQAMRSPSLLQGGNSGILNYLVVWKPDWVASKDLLRRMGWSMIASSMRGPNQIEFPIEFYTQMNILLWNCRGALNSDFKRRVFEMTVNHYPFIMVITETRVGGDRAEKIIEGFPFDGYFCMGTRVCRRSLAPLEER